MKGPIWQKSTYSDGGDGNDCVELASSTPTTLHLRESETPVTSSPPPRPPSAISSAPYATGFCEGNPIPTREPPCSGRRATAKFRRLASS
ncbi:DUF397 domain-containing protein [Streptomyces antibioticus]|uniref:DUF397 domain-containing protein n=1 Tax=Streptomyces antibioticus TaxID=1890 RepID=A0AAE7CLK6_STRAT|nr:DUF397 domain-containing protein [Streptomyces antibioticus]